MQTKLMKGAASKDQTRELDKQDRNNDGTGEDFLLKKLNVLTFLFAVADYDDEYLNICGRRMYEEGGNAYALQKGHKTFAYALIGKAKKTYIAYLFTPPELRGQGYARAIIGELQKEFAGLNCFIRAENNIPGQVRLDELLCQSGFAVKYCMIDFVVKIDDIREWIKSPFWEKYKKYIERYRQKGLEIIPFDRATAEQQDYVLNSFSNDFQSSIDPKQMLKPGKYLDLGLSSILLKNNQPVAFTFVKHPADRLYTIALASTAKQYVGTGVVFLLYCEAAQNFCRQSRQGGLVKYIIRDTNTASLKMAKHFCSQLRVENYRTECYEWGENLISD